MKRYQQAILEVIALAAVACLIGLWMPGGAPTSLSASQQIVFRCTQALLIYVAFPLVPVAAVGGLYTAVISKTRNYWRVWRSATVIAVIWLVVGNLGTWYGECRSHHPISQCP